MLDLQADILELAEQQFHRNAAVAGFAQRARLLLGLVDRCEEFDQLPFALRVSKGITK